MICNSHCIYYPTDSFQNPEYEYDKYGVKHAKKKKHYCLFGEEPKEIVSHEECINCKINDENT